MLTAVLVLFALASVVAVGMVVRELRALPPRTAQALRPLIPPAPGPAAVPTIGPVPTETPSTPRNVFVMSPPAPGILCASCGGKRRDTLEGVAKDDGSGDEAPALVSAGSPCGRCGRTEGSAVKCRGTCRALRCEECAAL